MVQANSPPSAPANAMSRGAFSTTSGPAKRRSSAAPAAACKVAPKAMISGRVKTSNPTWERNRPRPVLTTNAPTSTPGNAARPKVSTAASAMPAEGYSGDA